MGKNTDIQESFETVRMDPIDVESIMNSLGNGDIQVGMHQIIGTRSNQQDSLAYTKSNGRILAVVCDGMGGLSGGERASQTAVQVLYEDFMNMPRDISIPDFLMEEAERMDAAVASLTDNNGDPLDSGTTVVAVIIESNRLYWLSVGDSRIYLMRGDRNNFQIMPINRDHNYRLVLNEKIRTGQITEEEYHAEEDQAEALISYLGIGNVGNGSLADVNGFQLMENDIVILCSDGLYKRLPDNDIGQLVFYEEPEMKSAAERLTDVVMQRTQRNQDNTSIILLQYKYKK